MSRSLPKLSASGRYNLWHHGNKPNYVPRQWQLHTVHRRGQTSFNLALELVQKEQQRFNTFKFEIRPVEDADDKT